MINKTTMTKAAIDKCYKMLRKDLRRTYFGEHLVLPVAEPKPMKPLKWGPSSIIIGPGDYE